MRINSVINIPKIGSVKKEEEEKIIPQLKLVDLKTELLVRSMDEYEESIFEERLSIMMYENEITEEIAKVEAAKDIISLRDYSGTSRAIVELLGGLELRNENIDIHGGVRR